MKSWLISEAIGQRPRKVVGAVVLLVSAGPAGSLSPSAAHLLFSAAAKADSRADSGATPESADCDAATSGGSAPSPRNHAGFSSAPSPRNHAGHTFLCFLSPPSNAKTGLPLPGSTCSTSAQCQLCSTTASSCALDSTFPELFGEQIGCMAATASWNAASDSQRFFKCCISWSYELAWIRHDSSSTSVPRGSLEEEPPRNTTPRPPSRLGRLRTISKEGCT